MTTAEKSEAILKKIVELCNSGKKVGFEDDMGGNTLTIMVGGGHTHCGIPDGEFDLLVNNLYNSFHGGPGLSWHDPEAVQEDGHQVVS